MMRQGKQIQKQASPAEKRGSREQLIFGGMSRQNGCKFVNTLELRQFIKSTASVGSKKIRLPHTQVLVDSFQDRRKRI
jgi:hypothetical protein